MNTQATKQLRELLDLLREAVPGIDAESLELALSAAYFAGVRDGVKRIADGLRNAYARSH